MLTRVDDSCRRPEQSDDIGQLDDLRACPKHNCDGAALGSEGEMMFITALLD